MTDWRCAYCHAILRITPHWGGWSFICFNQNDGDHPVIISVTSNSTVLPTAHDHSVGREG